MSRVKRDSLIRRDEQFCCMTNVCVYAPSRMTSISLVCICSLCTSLSVLFTYLLTEDEGSCALLLGYNYITSCSGPHGYCKFGHCKYYDHKYCGYKKGENP